MLPTLRPGDLLWVRYDVPPRAGELVVARFADGTVAVKRAHEQRSGGWWLLSDNAAEGIDSRHRGAVPADQILAVVRRRLPRPYARLRSRPTTHEQQEI